MTVDYKNLGGCMKYLISVMAMASALTVSQWSSAESVPAKKDVAINVSDVFVPGGFGPNTDAYVIVSGMFPNSCYSWARSEVTHTTPLVHEVRSIASVSQTMCLMVLVPYTREVTLGRLQSGSHTLRFIGNDGTYFEKNLVVE